MDKQAAVFLAIAVVFGLGLVIPVGACILVGWGGGL